MIDFRQTLKRYSQPVTIITKAGGQWDVKTGQWQEGTPGQMEVMVPVLPLTGDDMRFDDLAYNVNDRKIYYHDHLDQGQKVEIDGFQYSVMATRDFSHHAKGLRIYILRRTDSGT